MSIRDLDERGRAFGVASDSEILRLADVGALTIFHKSLSDLAAGLESLGQGISEEVFGALVVFGKAAEDAGLARSAPDTAPPGDTWRTGASSSSTVERR